MGTDDAGAPTLLPGFGAESNATGDPIGGGEGYRRIKTQGDYYVGDDLGLLDALVRAGAGQVIHVADDAEIDLTGEAGIVIPGGVTLASGRGKGDSPGGLIFTEELETSPLFATGGREVRITGLRIHGPDPETRAEQLERLWREGGSTAYYTVANSDGLRSKQADLEVDNCELSGWSHAAIYLMRGSRKAHIHHNHIHHNRRWGLGYGVCLDRSKALIEANLFDYCRHHIAGTGAPGTSYEARYNLVLAHANGHSFDMHGGADRGDGTDVAGDRIEVHHNTFHAADVPAVVVRGRPRRLASVHHNWFLQTTPRSAIVQSNATGNLEVGPNQFGPGRVVKPWE